MEPDELPMSEIEGLYERMKEYERQSDHLGIALATECEARAADAIKYNDLLEKYQKLVDWYDKQNGTPCEQVRHAAALADAQATVEALQRERDGDVARIGQLCEQVADLERQLRTEEASSRVALDAEREKVKALLEAVGEQVAEDEDIPLACAVVEELHTNVETLTAQLDDEREKVKAAKAEVWREAAMKYALWVGEDSEVPADPHLDGYERFEEYCRDRATMDATTPARWTDEEIEQAKREAKELSKAIGWLDSTTKGGDGE